MKNLVLILDALDIGNIKQLNLDFIYELTKNNSHILGCSTLPHTAASNPMIWGGIENNTRYWVEEDEKSQEYTDPAMHFDRETGKPKKGASGFSRNDDYANESFIWDDLYAAGYDARAIQVPIVLPPYSFNSSDTLEDSWFPDNENRMAEHIRKKPQIIKNQFDEGAEFVATSIQMPDKWLHGIPEGKCDREWVDSEAKVLDNKIKNLVEYCNENDIEFTIFGDHGSPTQGAMKTNGYILPRHRKESVIIYSDGLNPPKYTDELYSWMKSLYNVESVNQSMDMDDSKEADVDEVNSRLEALGYK